MQHLAQWSTTERKRRATLRKDTKLVMPTAPVTTAQLSQLSRSASQLARRPSQAARAARDKRRRSKSFTQVADDDDVDGDASAGGRSMRLLDRRRSHSSSNPPSPIPPVPDRFAGGYGEGTTTPTYETLKPQLASRKPGLAPIITGPPPPGSGTPPQSAVSDGSTVVNPFTSPAKSAHHHSRFVEDLPPQSPVKDRETKPTTPLAPTPASASPLFATGDGSASRASLDSLIHPTPPSQLQSSPDIYSMNDPFTDAAGDVDSIPTPTAVSFHAALNGSARQPHGQSQPAAAAGMRGWAAADDRDYGEGGDLNAEEAEEEEEDDDHSKSVGILDWLLCGCFRGADDREGEQAGRTNPME